MKYRNGYVLIAAVNILICYLAYPFHFHQLFNSSFCNYGDGMKNNFTLIQFVKEPIGEKGIFHFEFFQYPFGDYVFTADNTPIFALIMRWINHYCFDISQFTIPIFNLLLISNFVVCGLLLYYICQRIFKNKYWAIAISIAIPFLLEQSLRLSRGHYNLSLSSIFVLGIILCYWYAEFFKHKKSVWKVLIGMWILSLVGFLIHGYYLPILTVLFGVYLLVFHCSYIFSKRQWFLVLHPILLVATIGITSYLLMISTDGYFNLRQVFAQSYDSLDQRLSPSFLYYSFEFNSIQFPLKPKFEGGMSEPHQFLGNGFWTIFLFIGCYSLLFQQFRRKVFASFQSINHSDFLKPILIAGFILFSIACGSLFFSHSIQVEFAPILNIDFKGLTVKSIIGLLCLIVSAVAFIVILISTILQIKIAQKWERKDKLQFGMVVLVGVLLVLFYFSNLIPLKNVPNVMNPFFYLQKITRIVEQFRSLARFVWPFSIIISIIIVHVYIRAQQVLPKKVRIASSLIIALVTFSQLVDWVDFSYKGDNRVNMFSKEALSDIPTFNNQEYEAVLSLPFFMVGSEDYNVTIDDFNNFSLWLYQFAYKNQLPLMSSKLSRTPSFFSTMMMELLITAKMPKGIYDSLKKEKPILVVFSKEWMEEKQVDVLQKIQQPEIYKTAYQANNAQIAFVKNANLKLIKSEGAYDFYEWKIEDY